MNEATDHGDSHLRLPMTAADIARLAAWLEAAPHALPLEQVDGLFCALIASAHDIPPAVYLAIVLTGQPDVGIFERAGDLNEVLLLLARYWNGIVSGFHARTAVHAGYALRHGADDVIGRGWARGFMLGTRLTGAGWLRWFDDPQETLALSIPLVAGEVDPNWPHAALSEAQNDELLMTMFTAAVRAFDYFASWPDGALTDGGLHWPQERPMRSSLCACGSGLQHSRCCGMVAARVRH